MTTTNTGLVILVIIILKDDGMNNLDDKLREILDTSFPDGMDLSDDPEAIPKIKQAFIDEGYVKIRNVTVRKAKSEDFKSGMVGQAHGVDIYSINGDENIMTGKEWYERFSAELRYGQRHRNKGMDGIAEWVAEAAKKASGIK
jgi:hypothetical protein